MPEKFTEVELAVLDHLPPQVTMIQPSYYEGTMRVIKTRLKGESTQKAKLF